MTWPIFNYGRLTNAVRVEDARYQEAIAAYQSAVLVALQEVEDNLVAFLRTKTQAEALARSAKAARRSVDLALLQGRPLGAGYPLTTLGADTKHLRPREPETGLLSVYGISDRALADQQYHKPAA